MSKQTTLNKALSYQRLSRYYYSCNNNAKLGIMLYELNSYLSVSLFRAIGVFEVTFRNSIDKLCKKEFGKDWLQQSVVAGGMFDTVSCEMTNKAIKKTIKKLREEKEKGKRRSFSHNDIVAKLEFGFWKYQFAAPQYKAAGGILLNVFPNKPTSTKTVKYNQKYFYAKLDYLNELRNRIAHHEPICFQKYKPIIDTTQAENCVVEICDLLKHMELDYNHLIGDCEDMKFIIKKIQQLQRIVNGKAK